MGTKNQIPIMVTHLKKKKQDKFNTKDGQQTTKEDNKKRMKILRRDAHGRCGFVAPGL